MSDVVPADLRIERVDRPFPALLALSIRMGTERACLIVYAHPRAPRVGIVSRRPKGDAIDAQGMQLRGAIEGARIDGLEVTREHVRLALRTLDGPRILVATFDHGAARFRLDESTDVLAHIEHASLVEAGESVLREATVEAVRALLAPCVKHAKTALARADRTLVAIARDASRIEDVPALRSDAALLLAQHARLPRGATTARVIDYSTSPEEERTITLDPSKTAKEAAEAMFARARRLERGRAHADARAQLVEQGKQKLKALLRDLDACREIAEAEALVARANLLGVVPQTQGTPKRIDRDRVRTPHRRFVSQDGTEIWVGRSAQDNDALTVRLAKPHHIFLHVRGVPGSHVIVALPKGAALGSETLIDAATLAVHFSTQRGTSLLEVLYVPRKHVRKPRGAAVGSVIVTREKVIALRLEPARLARLLRTEIGTLGAS